LPLGFFFNGALWFCRQLQNGRLLILTQSCQERDPAIRKFQGIVMRRDFVLVDLPKDRCLMLDHLIAPDQGGGKRWVVIAGGSCGALPGDRHVPARISRFASKNGN
jgi:hypothetical protein